MLKLVVNGFELQKAMTGNTESGSVMCLIWVVTGYRKYLRRFSAINVKLRANAIRTRADQRTLVDQCVHLAILEKPRAEIRLAADSSNCLLTLFF